jgi:hypothetical protein
VTRITFASPVEPSGASWLINCLLELGIKVAHQPVADAVWRHTTAPAHGIWQPASDGEFRLHRRANVLKKFLPVLSRVDTFRFRDDVEVNYVQDLAIPSHADRIVLCFVRDPRDSVYSAYRRLQPGNDYDAFLRVPDPDTLLDRPSQWSLWIESWMTLSHSAWFTFEDYKRDGLALLQRILEHLQLTYAKEEIERAVAESTFDKARRAEEQYRAPQDREIANRSGRVGGWMDDADGRAGAAFIEEEAGGAMGRLGYGCSTSNAHSTCISPVLQRSLPIFAQICLPDSARDAARGAGTDAQLDRLREFAGAVDEEALRRTNLPNHRIHRLLENLERVAQADGWSFAPRLAALRQQFVEGSEHQFAQMRDLLLQQRQHAR